MTIISVKILSHRKKLNGRLPRRSKRDSMVIVGFFLYLQTQVVYL